MIVDLKELFSNGLPEYEDWHAIARRSVGKEDAEDVVQEVTLYLWERSQKGQWKGEYTPQQVRWYIWRAIANAAATRVRANAARQKKSDVFEADGIMTTVEASAEDRAILNDLTSTLTEQQYAAWQLVMVEGMTYREAGAEMGRNHKTVHELVERARANMAAL